MISQLSPLNFSVCFFFFKSLSMSVFFSFCMSVFFFLSLFFWLFFFCLLLFYLFLSFYLFFFFLLSFSLFFLCLFSSVFFSFIFFFFLTFFFCLLLFYCQALCLFCVCVSVCLVKKNGHRLTLKSLFTHHQMLFDFHKFQNTIWNKCYITIICLSSHIYS